MHSKPSKKYLYSACWGLGAGLAIVLFHLLWGPLAALAIALLLVGGYLGWQQRRSGRSSRRSRKSHSTSETEQAQIWSFQALEVSDETRVSSPRPGSQTNPTTVNPDARSSRGVQPQPNPTEPPTIAKPVNRTRPAAKPSGASSQPPRLLNQGSQAADEQTRVRPPQSFNPPPSLNSIEEQTIARQGQRARPEAGHRSGIANNESMTRPMRPPSTPVSDSSEQARTIMRHSPSPEPANEQNVGQEVDPDAATIMRHRKKTESDHDRFHS